MIQHGLQDTAVRWRRSCKPSPLSALAGSQVTITKQGSDRDAPGGHRRRPTRPNAMRRTVRTGDDAAPRLGVLIRSSAGALVAYFVYSFLLPTLSVLLAASQDWFRHLQPWIDFKYAQGTLIHETVTNQQWAHLGVTATPWLVVPLAIGLRLVT